VPSTTSVFGLLAAPSRLANSPSFHPLATTNTWCPRARNPRARVRATISRPKTRLPPQRIEIRNRLSLGRLFDCHSQGGRRIHCSRGHHAVKCARAPLTSHQPVVHGRHD